MCGGGRGAGVAVGEGGYGWGKTKEELPRFLFYVNKFSIKK